MLSLSVSSLFVLAPAFDSPTSFAACATGAPPELTRVVGVATGVEAKRGDGVYVALATDDNVEWSIYFPGRSDQLRSDGTENTVEDAWKGDLPIIGERYAVDGWQTGDQRRLIMDSCVNASVERLDDIPSSAPVTVTAVETATTSPPAGADDGDSSSAPYVFAGVAALVLMGVVATLVARRRPGP